VTIHVRTAMPSDVADVVAVGHETWPPTYEPLTGPEYVAEGLARFWTHDVVAALVDQGRVRVAHNDDGRVVAMASTEPAGDTLILRRLYVIPSAQGSGAGTALLTRVVADASGSYVAIHLEHVAGNESAATFYARHGFAYHSRTSNANGPETIWLRRELPAS
jgi:GNAT superfamily N-acetyltransferase